MWCQLQQNAITRAKLQTFRQAIQITTQRSTPNHGKQKSSKTAVFIQHARSHLGKGQSACCCNSKFRQAVNWCHTSHQLALNTGTLRPEAHVAASCVLQLSQRKQKPPGSHKLAKQNHSSSESYTVTLPPYWQPFRRILRGTKQNTIMV